MHKIESGVCLTHGWRSRPRPLPSHSSRTEKRSKTLHSVMLFLVNEEVTNSFEDNQQTFLWTDLQQSNMHSSTMIYDSLKGRTSHFVYFGRQQTVKKEASIHNQIRIVMSGEKGGRLEWKWITVDIVLESFWTLLLCLQLHLAESHWGPMGHAVIGWPVK